MPRDETPTGPERTTPYEGAHDRPDLDARFGRFGLRGLLGEGSFGRVYRAYDPTLDREVALKVPTFPPDRPDLAERFVREARAAARLRHPNIVAVFETGQADGRLYIATELVSGQTLFETVKGERPSVRRAVEWVRSLALALHYAHEEGVVHRDVKPSNIMIDTRGRAQLMDFGLAKRVEADGPVPLVADADDPTRTAAGTVLGTPGYMSPEQARGELDAVGPHSDQYSLGVVLYELLAGVRPFTGGFAELREKVGDPNLTAESPRRHSRKVPPELADVCLKAIDKRPHRRYATMADFAIDLQRWLNDEPVSVLRTPRARAQGWAGRLREADSATIQFGLAALVVLFAVGFYAYQFWPWRSDKAGADAPLQARQESHSAKVDLYRERGLRLRAEGKPAEAALWLAHAYALADGGRRRAVRADFAKGKPPPAPPGLQGEDAQLWRLAGLCLLGVPLPEEERREPLFTRYAVDQRLRSRTGYADGGESVLTAEFLPGGGRWRLVNAVSRKPVGPAFFEDDKVLFSPSGRHAVVSGSVWSILDLGTGEVVGPKHDRDWRPLALAFNPDGTRLAVLSEGTPTTPAPWAQAWDVATAKPLPGRVLFHGYDGRPNRTLFLRPDAKAVAVGGSGWGSLFAEFDGEVKRVPGGGSILGFLPGGDGLFVAQDGASVRSVDLAGADGSVTIDTAAKELVVSADGRRALTRSEEGESRLWDLEARAAIDYPFLAAGRVQTLAFRPDGREVLIVGPDEARAWPVPHAEDVAAAALLWAELGAGGTLPLNLFDDAQPQAFAADELASRVRKLRELAGRPVP